MAIDYGGISIAQASNKFSNGQLDSSSYNGLSGFKRWECYMVLKYGRTNTFGVTNRNPSLEYLIEIPIYPESVSESLESRWDSQDVLGRSSSLAAYAGTSLKTVNFHLDLHRDLMTGSYSMVGNVGPENRQAAGLQTQTSLGPFQTRRWYVKINKMLQMSCYPQYTKQRTYSSDNIFYIWTDDIKRICRIIFYRMEKTYCQYFLCLEYCNNRHEMLS